MRFSSNRYPLLADPGFNFIHYDSLEDMIPLKDVKDVCTRILKDIGVQYVSREFYNTSITHSEKLWDHADDVLDQPYCIALPGGDSITIGNLGFWTAIFSKRQLQVFGYNRAAYSRREKREKQSIDDEQEWVLSAHPVYRENEKEKEDLRTVMRSMGQVIVAILLFRKYAEIRPKVLPPHKRMKDFHCKYTSDIIYPVELLTENWYTVSEQSNPFFVRGHWRHQRYGEGLKESKLKWIDTFKKSGYTKGAYKEKQ